jgi:hypothetical protein
MSVASSARLEADCWPDVIRSVVASAASDTSAMLPAICWRTLGGAGDVAAHPVGRGCLLFNGRRAPSAAACQWAHPRPAGPSGQRTGHPPPTGCASDRPGPRPTRRRQVRLGVVANALVGASHVRAFVLLSLHAPAGNGILRPRRRIRRAAHRRGQHGRRAYRAALGDGPPRATRGSRGRDDPAATALGGNGGSPPTRSRAGV